MLNTRTESKTEMENNLKDNASALVEGHVLIKDTDTGEVLLNKHNAINFTNMALAMARVLGGEVDAGSGLSYVIKKMAFGNGGTLIDGTGTIEYRSTNTDTEAGALYNKTYEKLVDGTDAILPSENTTVVQKFDGLVYSDIVITSTLDYTEPVAQATIDNSTNLTGDFAFDEIGLITETGSYISHIIFHPIEKSANRKIQVIYTIRIRAGS
jgi:hypothetical protein